MYSIDLRKPDGRRLILYSRSPIGEGLVAPSRSAPSCKMGTGRKVLHPVEVLARAMQLFEE